MVENPEHCLGEKSKSENNRKEWTATIKRKFEILPYQLHIWISTTFCGISCTVAFKYVWQLPNEKAYNSLSTRQKKFLEKMILYLYFYLFCTVIMMETNIRSPLN